MAGRMRERMIQVVMDADLGFALPVEYDAAEAIVDTLLASNEVVPFGAASAMVGEFAEERDRYRQALELIAEQPTPYPAAVDDPESDYARISVRALARRALEDSPDD